MYHCGPGQRRNRASEFFDSLRTWGSVFFILLLFVIGFATLAKALLGQIIPIAPLFTGACSVGVFLAVVFWMLFTLAEKCGCTFEGNPAVGLIFTSLFFLLFAHVFSALCLAPEGAVIKFPTFEKGILSILEVIFIYGQAAFDFVTALWLVVLRSLDIWEPRLHIGDYGRGDYFV